MFTFTSAQIDMWLATGLLPFIRLLALFSAAPLLSHRSFPARSRIVLAAAITVVIAPVVQVPAGMNLSSASAVGLVVQQVGVGLALGFALRMLFAVFEIAGEAIGLQMGLSYAGFFDPAGGHQPAVGSWLKTMAMMLFLAMNGHLMVIDALVSSFRVVPIAPDPVSWLGLVQLETLGAAMFRIALVLALPPTITLLFVYAVLGYVSRVAPQLSIMSVGFPITLITGLTMLAMGSDHIQIALMEGMMAILAPLH